MRDLPERLAREAPVRAVREALADHGADVWIVGGTVRDAALGRPLTDVDLAVRGDPEEAARAVARHVGGPLFQLSDAFGAWRAIEAGRAWVCDVSPLHGATVEEDLGHRDFAANAVGVHLSTGDVVDPHRGIGDIRAGVLRVLGGPRYEQSAYAADPIRALRLARLSAELPLRPDADTERLTRLAAAGVPKASPERVFAELRRLLIAERALDGLELADRLGLVAAVLPELDALHGVEQSHFHHLDVYAHTLEVLSQLIGLTGRLGEVFRELAPDVGAVLDEPLGDDLTRDQALRLGALLHDVGKPATRRVRPDGRVTFIGHDAVGEEMVTAICRRLRVSERVRQYVAQLTRHHLALGFLVHERPLSRRTVYRYLTACHPIPVEVTTLSCADRLATRGENADAAIAAHLEVARELMAEALAWRSEGPPKPPVRGDELARRLGIEPGPELGELLSALREARFAGEIATPDEAVELARRLRQNPAR